MVKNSPNERLRLLQRTMDAGGDAAAATGTQAPPALKAPGDATTQEGLRRAAEVRAAADAQDSGFPTPLNPHVNMNTHRRRGFMADADAIHADDFQDGGGDGDDLGGSFTGDDLLGVQVWSPCPPSYRPRETIYLYFVEITHVSTWN